MLSQQSSAPHPCVGSSLPVQDGKNAPPTSDDIDREEKQSEEAAQLAMKAAEAFLGSQDHNDIEGSQYQLVSVTMLTWPLTYEALTQNIKFCV